MQSITVTMVETITTARRLGLKRRYIEITPEITYGPSHTFSGETVGMWLDKDDEAADDQIMTAEQTIMAELGFAHQLYTTIVRSI